jgi:HAD superfamily hydrolase (TIGR01509 family)
MTELTALIFDVDGTLADTERDAHRVAFNDTFTAHHLDWYWSAELYGKLLAVTGGRERIKFYVTDYHPSLPVLKDLDVFIAQLHQEKTQRFLDIVKAGRVPLRSGVQRLLIEARQAGLRLAIATTTSYVNVQALLTHCIHPEAVSWFEVIAAGDNIRHKKPAPDVYYHALEQLNLQANQCLAIEDSDNGLRAALGAGICTIVTTNDYTREQDFSGATVVIDQLGEPYQPFTILAGNIGKAQWMDIPLLKSIFKT